MVIDPTIPILAISFSYLTKQQALWLAALTGLLLDLVVITPPLGFHATLFVLLALIFYPLAKSFKAMHEPTFALYTFLISFSFTLINILAFDLRGHLLYNLLVPPLSDGLLTFLFMIPYLCYCKYKKAKLDVIEDY